MVNHSLTFLNGGGAPIGVSSSVPEAVLKIIEEEELDAEERLQRCQADARQFLAVKPEMAWSRAQQGVMLLGEPGTPAAVVDRQARDAAHLTAAEICFALAMRGVKLPAELGRPDLFQQARNAAAEAGKHGLGLVISLIGIAQRALPAGRLQPLAEMAQRFVQYRDQITPWVLVEIAPASDRWVDELESGLFNGHNASVLLSILPKFYEVLGVAEREQRLQRLRQKSLHVLMQDKRFTEALAILQSLDPKQPRLEALCHEGLGNYRVAGECYRSTGDLKEALRCYRSIPDLNAALETVREIGNHPAAESLEWIARLEKVIAERPDKFNRVILAPEKKLLESLLEQSLGVTRKKPVAPKKTATKKASPKKAAPKKSVPKKPKPAPRWTDFDPF